jgi:RNA polymerase sigma-70 factor (ECF subfamily)
VDLGHVLSHRHHAPAVHSQPPTRRLRSNDTSAAALEIGARSPYAKPVVAGIIGRVGFKRWGNMADSAFATQLETHRRYLLRVASLQLRDTALAEDVVQDTLVAALQGEKGFSGKSSLRTWLTGILKHKVVDAIRQKTRAPTFASFDDECRVDDLDALFDETGHWENPPADWGNPESQLSEQQFFEVMQGCLENLPPNTARIFVMREVMELETDEICTELTITSNNLWVILHRARLSLRECLEQRWFATATSGASQTSAAQRV